MPSIIFVIYSGHKAREKSKLESEAKKRQKERAQRGTERHPTQNSANYGSSVERSKTPKTTKEFATQTTLSLLNEDKEEIRTIRNDGRLSSTSHRERADRSLYSFLRWNKI